MPKDLMMVEIVVKKLDEEIQHQMPIVSLSVMEPSQSTKQKFESRKSFDKTHRFA